MKPTSSADLASGDLAMVLRSLGYNVRIVANGPAALCAVLELARTWCWGCVKFLQAPPALAASCETSKARGTDRLNVKPVECLLWGRIFVE
jgi:hypothetical protein